MPAGTRHCHLHRIAAATADNNRRYAKRVDHGRQTSAWQTKRKQRLELDGGSCTQCGAMASTVHLDPAWGTDHATAPLDALTSLCTTCHGLIDGPRSRRGGVST